MRYQLTTFALFVLGIWGNSHALPVGGVGDSGGAVVLLCRNEMGQEQAYLADTYSMFQTPEGRERIKAHSRSALFDKNYSAQFSGLLEKLFGESSTKLINIRLQFHPSQHGSRLKDLGTDHIDLSQFKKCYGKKQLAVQDVNRGIVEYDPDLLQSLTVAERNYFYLHEELVYHYKAVRDTTPVREKIFDLVTSDEFYEIYAQLGLMIHYNVGTKQGYQITFELESKRGESVTLELMTIGFKCYQGWMEKGRYTGLDKPNFNSCKRQVKLTANNPLVVSMPMLFNDAPEENHPPEPFKDSLDWRGVWYKASLNSAPARLKISQSLLNHNGDAFHSLGGKTVELSPDQAQIKFMPAVFFKSNFDFDPFLYIPPSAGTR